MTEQKMNPEIKDLWCAALESGEYTKGHGALTVVTEDGAQQDCCLGVLCKLAAKA